MIFSSSKTVFSCLLCLLCAADTVFLVAIIPNILMSANIFPLEVSFITPITESIAKISMATSIFLIIAISIERYRAVSLGAEYHSRVLRDGLTSLVITYTTPAIVLAFLFNIPFMFYFSSFKTNFPDESYLRFTLYFKVVCQISV